MYHDPSFLTNPSEPAERAFNPWRGPSSEAAAALVEEVILKLLAHEERHGLRRRKRRTDDQTVRNNAAQAIICDLAVNALRNGGTGVYLPRSNRHLGNRTRYDHPANTRQLPAILDALSSQDLDLMEQLVGGELESGERRRTVAWPRSTLAELMLASGVGANDFVVMGGGETIVLKRTRRDF